MTRKTQLELTREIPLLQKPLRVLWEHVPSFSLSLLAFPPAHIPCQRLKLATKMEAPFPRNSTRTRPAAAITIVTCRSPGRLHAESAPVQCASETAQPGPGAGPGSEICTGVPVGELYYSGLKRELLNGCNTRRPKVFPLYPSTTLPHFSAGRSCLVLNPWFGTRSPIRTLGTFQGSQFKGEGIF